MVVPFAGDLKAHRQSLQKGFLHLLSPFLNLFFHFFGGLYLTLGSYILFLPFNHALFLVHSLLILLIGAALAQVLHLWVAYNQAVLIAALNFLTQIGFQWLIFLQLVPLLHLLLLFPFFYSSSLHQTELRWFR